MKIQHTLCLFACCLWLSAIEAQETLTPIPGQYIVLLKESAARAVVLEESAGATREETVLQNETKRQRNLNKVGEIRSAAGVADNQVIAQYADALVGFSATLSQEAADRLAANPDVESVSPDYMIQLDAQADEGLPGEMALQGQTVTCAIHNAGGFVNNSSSNKWLWILDTGIDLDHPDLNVNAQFPYAQSFIPGESADDAHGHGTHVAGIAAAKNNAFGVVGISAGAMVVPVKVLSNGGLASLTSVLQGLNHVGIYDKTGDVVNLSLGSYPVSNCPNSNPAVRTAITNLGNSGTWVCMASGNNAGRATSCHPGCINGTRVLTVGAMSCAGGCANFSNWGPTVVDWVATGVNVYSTHKNGKYATFSGTSQACPVVAGIVHATGQAPVSGGTINCANMHVPAANYKKARRQ